VHTTRESSGNVSIKRIFVSESRAMAMFDSGLTNK
jgi:hypothetical protein